MARKRTVRIARGREVDRVAKRLRAEIRKRARERPLLKALLRMAERLRERAVAVAGDVQKYIHHLRTDLEFAPPTRRPVRHGRAKRAA